MNGYKVSVTHITKPPTPNPWTRERFEFRFCAASWAEAIKLAGSNVKRGPDDEVKVQILYATPCSTRVAVKQLRSCLEVQGERDEAA
jgi:hypothetical protein